MKLKLPIYRYHNEMLDYKKIELSISDILKLFVIQIIISLGLMFCLSIFFNTPKENKLKGELNIIKTEFMLINRKTDEIQKLISSMEKKDSVIYQSLFNIDLTENKFESGYISEYSNDFVDTINYVGSKLSNVEMNLELINLRFRKLIIAIGENNNRLSHTPAIQPISNNDLSRTSSGFGYRIHPIYNVKKLHNGMDFVAPIGTDIHATADGIVIIASNSYYGYGKYVKIKHSDKYETAYAHLNEVKVKKGQKIKRGDIIGTLGNTGLSTGPHLHYEVHVDNQQVNPINYYYHDLTADQYEKMINISSSISKSMD